jgi:hypothetical protein
MVDTFPNCSIAPSGLEVQTNTIRKDWEFRPGRNPSLHQYQWNSLESPKASDILDFVLQSFAEAYPCFCVMQGNAAGL